MANRVFFEDIQRVISNEHIAWLELSNSTVFVTGATGLIGSILVHVLHAADDKYGLKLRIVGSGRNAPVGKVLTKSGGLDTFAEHDVREPFDHDALPEQLDYIFHCAAMTQSADMVTNPVDVITMSVYGVRNALELARAKRCRSFVYLSSMEAYGQTELAEVRESDLGYLDLSKPRSCYPESKRLCENLCAAYRAQYGVPAKIARLALTFGAGASIDSKDNRVAMQFARKAIAGEDIELHTSGDSIINCCYTADAISGLLLIALKGKNGEAYNIANPAAAVTVREMAETVADKVCGGRIGVITRIPDNPDKKGYAPDCGYVLNADKLKGLGWHPQYGLADMYKRLTADLEGQ